MEFLRSRETDNMLPMHTDLSEDPNLFSIPLLGGLQYLYLHLKGNQCDLDSMGTCNHRHTDKQTNRQTDACTHMNIHTCRHTCMHICIKIL